MKIKFDDVGFGYKAHPVFEHVSHELDGAGFCCLIGPNGAGKSTLLKCINGILKPTSGRILVDDRDVQSMSLKERAKIFGYVPQFASINPCLNVLETIVSGRMSQMNGKATQTDIEAAVKILNEMGLEKFAMRPLHQLSGGERQRIMIARAVAQEPDFMLLDEPTSNLDLHYQLETMELMAKTSIQRGIGIIAVIHDLNSVLRHADEVMLLDKGRLLETGRPEVVIDRNVLASSFKVDAVFTEAVGIRVMVPLSSLNPAIY